MPQFGINPGDAGNRRGIDFCVHKHQRVRCLHILYNKGRPAAKSVDYIPKIALKTSTYVCVLTLSKRIQSVQSEMNFPRVLNKKK